MTKAIRYLWGSEDLLIELGNRTEPRIRLIYYTEFLVTTGLATIFMLRGIHAVQGYVQVLCSLGTGLVYLLAAYRFLSRMFYTESLRITNDQLTIIRKTPFHTRSSSYFWQRMGRLHYKVREAKTDHPLKGKCFDYFGFDTQEQVVQDLHHEGNLFFQYDGSPVRFARGIYSWHAEEIVNMIRLFSGPALRLGAEWKDLLKEMYWER